MQLNFRDILSSTIILFAVLDILGSLPIVMSMKERGVKIDPLQTTLVATVLLISFMFLGEAMLGFFGVDLNSFAVAGAIVLFILGLEMILGKDFFNNSDGPASASVVPLAFPLLAGPGSFTTLLSIRAEYDTINVVIAVLINMALIYLVLKSSNTICKIVGASGIFVLKKFFGIILLAISVRLFTSNLALLIEKFTN